MAHPTRVTFPGYVKFAARPAKQAEGEPEWQEPRDENGKVLRVVQNADDRGEFRSTTVTAPPGKRFTYTIRQPAPVLGGKGRPTYVLTMLDDEAPEVVHAELEHVKATEDMPAHVVARSTKHAVDDQPLAAKGASAAEAVQHLSIAVEAHVAKSKAADDDAKKKADEARIAAEVAAELHNSKLPPKGDKVLKEEHDDGELVTRHG